MKIAMPAEDGLIFGHFGGTKSFYIADIDDESKSIVHEAVFAAPEHVPGAFPIFLREKNIGVVIAQGMGAHAKSLLEGSGIEVITGVSTASPRKLVESYLADELESRDVECNHDHHGKSHC